MALANKVAEGKGKPKAELKGCQACPMAGACGIKDTDESCDKKAKEGVKA
jgi:hypothetical protein